jgi:hypothetical protein
MRKTITTVLAASLIAALTAQTAVASEHHRAGAKSRAVATAARSACVYSIIRFGVDAASGRHRLAS